MEVLRDIKFRSLHIMLLTATALLFMSQFPESREYKVKAIFLFNFTQFVEWPDDAFSDKNSPLIIGVLGNNPFSPYLEQAVTGETVNGHSIIARHYQDIQQAKNSHVLFINLTDPDSRRQAIESVKGRSILTVGESPDFIQQGGMIRFHTVSNKIQFQINPEAAQAANLTISSRLLKLAEIVTPN